MTPAQQAKLANRYNAHREKIADAAVRGPGTLWPTPPTMPFQEAVDITKAARAAWIKANPGKALPWALNISGLRDA